MALIQLCFFFFFFSQATENIKANKSPRSQKIYNMWQISGTGK